MLSNDGRTAELTISAPTTPQPETAEGMLDRARVAAGETLLVTGASGGVGSALVQLAKRRGAAVVALAGESKMAAVRDIGADHVLPRDIEGLGGALLEATGRDFDGTDGSDVMGVMFAALEAGDFSFLIDNLRLD